MTDKELYVYHIVYRLFYTKDGGPKNMDQVIRWTVRDRSWYDKHILEEVGVKE